jgi:hypothetical protein
MAVISRSLLVAAGVVLLVSPAWPADKDPDRPWDLVAVGNARIAVPKGWRDMDNICPGMVVYRNGDGISVPPLDDTRAPLQVGLNVERFPKSKDSAKEIIDRLAEGAKNAPRLELVGKPTVEAVKLSDGTEGMLLTAEFVKEGSRRSLQMKLAVKGTDGTAWVVSGHVVGGKESKWPTADSKLAKWLRAHLSSFTLDEKKFDADRLRTAYSERDRK